ncbi:hypothetical protein RO3G_10338 [Lichtheimia corymbifera JMRC:FSU:9682]|uniref:Uncharacterized protein n=1 Tax=Lichtheimia corymbifera JMRC:FSU:9682 TaxID=1263082 RepID=A0A068SFD1_9FUNG|nr:hypothetical protein RO3G_10338 [Lichtheimia corymbifera JMRC:FSU:9682]
MASIDDAEKKQAMDIADDDESAKTRIQERSITRKLDLHVLPVLFLLYMFGSVDKSNISNAKLGGLEQDLGLTPVQYRWCLSIVFVGMVLFQIPVIIILRRWKANLLIGMMAMLFILEGIPSVLLGVIAFWCLPIRPADAKFLTDDEKKLQIERFTKDQGTTNFRKKYTWKDTKELLKDWKPYLYSYIALIGIAAGSGFNLTLPAIVHGMGNWSPAVSQALTVPPNVCACILTVAAGYSSGKPKLGNLIMRVFIMLLVSQIVSLTENASAAVAISWTPSSFGTFTRRAVALGVVGTVGFLGGVIGPQFYYDGPRYLHGYTIAVCLVISQTITLVLLRFLLWRENKKRDNMIPEEKQRIIEKYDLQETGDDRHPDFRYIL